LAKCSNGHFTNLSFKIMHKLWNTVQLLLIGHGTSGRPGSVTCHPFTCALMAYSCGLVWKTAEVSRRWTNSILQMNIPKGQQLSANFRSIHRKHLILP
jgi:hypothetical protein